MPRSVLALLVLAGAISLPLCAQDTDTTQASALAPGTRVRLTLDTKGDSSRTIRPGRYVGTLRAAGVDSVQVQLAGADASESLPWTVVSRLEVSRGVNKPLKVTAMSLGAVGGALLGHAAGDAMTTVECHDSGHVRVCEESWSDGTVELLSAVVGAAAGAGLGKLVAGRERWAEAAMPRRVNVRPWGGRRGVGVGVAVRLAF
jgi:hypothetical protein